MYTHAYKNIPYFFHSLVALERFLLCIYGNYKIPIFVWEFQQRIGQTNWIRRDFHVKNVMNINKTELDDGLTRTIW